MTILLYNGECWSLKKQDIKKLEGFHFRCPRRLTRKRRRPGLGDMVIDRASRDDVFTASRTPSVEELLAEKRLRWFGHLMREDDDEPAKQLFWRESEHNSKWFQLLSSDLTSRKVSFGKAQSLASNKSIWRKLGSAMCERIASKYDDHTKKTRRPWRAHLDMKPPR